jgi:tetratricopeptide (TPR) repeat protein
MKLPQLSLRDFFRLVALVVAITPTMGDTKEDSRREYYDGLQKSDEQQYERAIEHFTKAVELDPEYSDAYAARAKAYEAIDDLESSFKDREKAAQLRVAEDFSRGIGGAIVQRPEFWLVALSFVGCGVIAVWVCIRRINMLRGSRAPDFGEQDNWGADRKT